MDVGVDVFRPASVESMASFGSIIVLVWDLSIVYVSVVTVDSLSDDSGVSFLSHVSRSVHDANALWQGWIWISDSV